MVIMQKNKKLRRINTGEDVEKREPAYTVGGNLIGIATVENNNRTTIWPSNPTPGHQFSSVQLLSRVQLFETPWITAHQASLSITNSRSLLKLMCIESLMPSNDLSSVVPFSSHFQSFPESGSFQMSQFFTVVSWIIGVLSSVLPMNIQDWSPLGWTGWISLQSKGLSRVSSNTTVQKHQFFGAQPSSQSNSHIHVWLLEKP